MLLDKSQLYLEGHAAKPMIRSIAIAQIPSVNRLTWPLRYNTRFMVSPITATVGYIFFLKSPIPPCSSTKRPDTHRFSYTLTRVFCSFGTLPIVPSYSVPVVHRPVRRPTYTSPGVCAPDSESSRKRQVYPTPVA